MRTLPCVAVVLGAVVPAVLVGQDVRMMGHHGDHAVIGVSTAPGGVRDTIGVLVSDVTIGGPADKAGIEEGDRIVSIGDVDLRLAAADAVEGMGGATHAVMARRLGHAVAKHAAGDVVELRVYHDGQFVVRKVTTGKASEVFVMPAMSSGNLDYHFHVLDPVLDPVLDGVKELRLPDMRTLEMHMHGHSFPHMDSGAFQFQTYENSTHRI